MDSCDDFFDDDVDDSSFALIEDLSTIEVEISQTDEELREIEVHLSLLLHKQEELRERRCRLIERLETSKAARQPAAPESHTGIPNTNANHSSALTDKYGATAAFPWSQQVDDVKQRIFNINKFRPFQIETINATMSKEDVILIMPTGGGKSLCFQLPALVEDGITLVVSPLISLMEDQVDAMRRISVEAAHLTGSSTKEEGSAVQRALTSRGSTLKLLYVTPERIAKSKRFMNHVEKSYELGQLKRIVVDEVHCTSQWGHDFRPDYKKLSIIKLQFPDIPILGLTATATTRVLDDVKQILQIPKCLVFKASFNRENLMYEVKLKPSSAKDCSEELKSIIKKQFLKQSGIVYCLSRNQAEQVAGELSSGGIKAACYHAEMSPTLRTKVHRQWTKNEIQVVVATIAFGMGIDKQDVRFVIHHSVSKTIENFYQETGRAGRDGQMAHCVLYFRSADAYRLSSMVFNTQNGLQGLYSMLRYSLDGSTCRRSLLARHFGEHFDPSQCNSCCDHCQMGPSRLPPEQDISELCQGVLTVVRHNQMNRQRLTALKLAEAWRGIGPSKFRVSSVVAPSLTSEQCESIILYMVVEDILHEEFHFTAYSTISYIVSGSKANAVQSGARRVYFRIPGTVKLNRATCILGDSPSSVKPVAPIVSMHKAPVVIQKAAIQYGDDDDDDVTNSIKISKPVRSTMAAAFQNRVTKARSEGQGGDQAAVNDVKDSVRDELVSSGSRVDCHDGQIDVVCTDSCEIEKAFGDGCQPAKRRKAMLVDLDNDDDANNEWSLFDKL